MTRRIFSAHVVLSTNHFQARPLVFVVKPQVSVSTITISISGKEGAAMGHVHRRLLQAEANKNLATLGICSDGPHLDQVGTLGVSEFKHLKSRLKGLMTIRRHDKHPQYWKLVYEAIDKFPIA